MNSQSQTLNAGGPDVQPVPTDPSLDPESEDLVDAPIPGTEDRPEDWVDPIEDPNVPSSN